MTDTKPPAHSNDPLHGITLEQLLTHLVDTLGWSTLGDLVRINCFRNNPGIKSSLTFLRRTPWARAQTEAVYIGLVQGEDVAAIRKRLKTMAAAGPAKSKPPARNQPSSGTAEKKQPAVNPWHKHQS